MIRTSISTAVILIVTASAAGAQQAPLPPKTVNPTPVNTSNCRGCSDATSDKVTPMTGYDDKAVDATPRKSPSVATTAPKPMAKAKKAKHKRHAHKSARKATHNPVAKPTVASSVKPVANLKDRPAVLDPMMAPRTAPAPAKVLKDTIRH
ncbi:MAG: hypothetical protein H0W63_12195 [Gemmatimonadaceae bacterium]|nr:hypothetical protein [Gemmatimonadaceae bacterium]